MSLYPEKLTDEQQITSLKNRVAALEFVVLKLQERISSTTPIKPAPTEQLRDGVTVTANGRYMYGGKFIKREEAIV